jgi:thiamine pyrophosphate-dependent acetolactate synthase large subunit-like protein
MGEWYGHRTHSTPGKGYEVVAAAIRAEGVDTLFGLLGNTNLALAGVLHGHGVRFVGTRHETGVLSLAAGYGWASGRPAACTVTHGPGLSNALTGLTSAVRDRAPVVLLVGDIRTEPVWSAQRADHSAMVAWTGAGFVDCDRPGRLVAAVAEGFRQAVARRRPVVVNLRADLLEGPAAEQEPAGPSPREEPPSPPEPEAVQRACRILAAADRPLILAGRGALWSGAGPALRELARRSGALLATSLPAKGLFLGDPFDLGVCGGYSTAATRELVAGSDVVLAVGVGLNGYTTDKGTLTGGATIVHCDLFPRGDADVAVRGDAGATAQALLASVEPMGRAGRRTADIAATVTAAREFTDGADTGGLDPRAVLRAVDRALPPDRQVVVDVGHFTTFPSQQLTVQEGRFLPALGFASVGLSIATGAGAALGRDAPTLVVVGDGGALMSLGELETLSRLGLPVTVLVLNDRAYGAEIHHLRRHGLPEELALFPEADLAGVARALGMPAATLREPADLGRLADLLAGQGPVLVDARVTRSVVADKFATQAKAVR